jgi:thiol-disulfide isomerase/thioredoxin
MIQLHKISTTLFFALLTLFSSYAQPEEGIWRGTLAMQGMELPFHIELKQDAKKWKVWIRNGEERMLMRDAVVTDDSLYIPMNLFDTYIKAEMVDGEMEGVFVKRYADNYSLPFRAEYGLEYRFFPESDEMVKDYSGKWEIKFTSDSLPSIGIFEQVGSKITGTIVTSTGDYRYLDGNVRGNTIYLSTFDGSHEFIFQASEMQKDQLVGLFLFGKKYKEGWTATKNPNITLSKPIEIGKANGEKLFEFDLKRLDGSAINQNDSALAGRPILLQIFGTWCSNSMDLSTFVDDWLQANPNSDFAWLGVGFESSAEAEYGKVRLDNWQSFMQTKATLAFGGLASKPDAALLFPALNKVNAFPTLVVLDENHVPVRTYGYFTGPASGQYFEEFKKDFEEVVKSISDKKK